MNTVKKQTNAETTRWWKILETSPVFMRDAYNKKVKEKNPQDPDLAWGLVEWENAAAEQQRIESRIPKEILILTVSTVVFMIVSVVVAHLCLRDESMKSLAKPLVFLGGIVTMIAGLLILDHRFQKKREQLRDIIDRNRILLRNFGSRIEQLGCSLNLLEHGHSFSLETVREWMIVFAGELLRGEDGVRQARLDLSFTPTMLGCQIQDLARRQTEFKQAWDAAEYLALFTPPLQKAELFKIARQRLSF